jgi:hypothetical protein
VHHGRPVTIQPLGEFVPPPVIADSDDRLHHPVFVDAVCTTNNRDIKNARAGQRGIIVKHGSNGPARRPQGGDHNFGMAASPNYYYRTAVGVIR